MNRALTGPWVCLISTRVTQGDNTDYSVSQISGNAATWEKLVPAGPPVCQSEKITMSADMLKTKMKLMHTHTCMWPWAGQAVTRICQPWNSHAVSNLQVDQTEHSMQRLGSYNITDIVWQELLQKTARVRWVEQYVLCQCNEQLLMLQQNIRMCKWVWKPVYTCYIGLNYS